MKEIAGIIGVLLLIAIAIQVCMAIYRGIDESGWIPHHEDTPVLTKGEWLVGEFRVCQMKGYRDIRLLDCASGEGITPHDLPVKYWGRLDREAQNTPWDWRCQRMQDHLVCKAVN